MFLALARTSGTALKKFTSIFLDLAKRIERHLRNHPIRQSEVGVDGGTEGLSHSGRR